MGDKRQEVIEVDGHLYLSIEFVHKILSGQNRSNSLDARWLATSIERARRNAQAKGARDARTELINKINIKHATPHIERLRKGDYAWVARRILNAVNNDRDAAVPKLPPYEHDDNGWPAGLIRSLKTLFSAV